jgi:hypothetical protein
MMDDLGRIIARLDYLAETVTRVEAKVDRINGEIRAHSEEIATLKATSLRVDAIKLSALVGVAILILGVMLKAAGIF